MFQEPTSVAAMSVACQLQAMLLRNTPRSSEHRGVIQPAHARI